MKLFQMRKLREALACAADGGQALHLHNVIVDPSRAPQCFVRAVRRGEWIAHLFDQDHERLYQTARRLGVRVLLVEHAGRQGQHIDLCGAPLRRAIAECKKEPTA